MARLTQQEIDTGVQVLKEYHEERRSMFDIAKMHDMTLDAVRWCIQRNTTVKKTYQDSLWDTRVTASQAKRVYELHQKGLPYAEIHKLTSVSPTDAEKAVDMIRERHNRQCERCLWRRDGWPVCCLPGCAKEGRWADGE